MVSSITHPLTTSTVGKIAGNTGWKLNQELLATVIDSKSRGRLLRIEGSTYAPLNRLDVAPGNTLQLRIAALSPFIELALVDATRGVKHADANAGIILSDKFLPNAPPSLLHNSAGLQRVLHLVNALSMQALPPASAALVAALVDRIALPGSLVNARTLKPTLRDASLLLAGAPLADSSDATEGSLQSLLLQLLRGLGGGNARSGQAPVSTPYGLALYQSVDTVSYGVAALLAREMEVELLRMFNVQRQPGMPAEDYTQRWLFELPINFQDRLRAISIRIHEEKRQNQDAEADSTWTASFSLELPACGQMQVRLVITDPVVTITMRCERRHIVNALVRHESALQERLAKYQLRLNGFTCETVPGSTLRQAQAVPETADEGTALMSLLDFKMGRNGQELATGVRIPDMLYCAMASLFNFILELESNYR